MSVWTEMVPESSDRLKEITVELRRLRKTVRRYAGTTQAARYESVISELEAEAVPLQADYEARRADYDARYARHLAEHPSGHTGEMSSYGLDLARSSLKRLNELEANPTPRARDPWTCPVCGGPTSVERQRCDEC